MLTPGTPIGRYEIKRKLAEGGMAEIFLATATGPEGFSKDVVIKVVRGFLASDQSFQDMFIAEARLASRLNHANIVQIFDFGRHDERYYLAMEYVRGASLFDLRKRCRAQGTPFPPTLAAEVAAQVARGLQFAHSLNERGQPLGIVHRDVTPQNILLSFDGAVKLTDFGIAKATSSQTAPGMLKGKFAYMSPEQGRGEAVDARTDVFALGIVLWELLTGGRLFQGDSDVAVLRSVQTCVIVPPSRLNAEVPQELSDIVLRALAREPVDRFQSALELERALSGWVIRTAQTVEDTSVALFAQGLYREEYEADRRQASSPAMLAVARRTEPEHDAIAHGDTHALNRGAVEDVDPLAPTHPSDRLPAPALAVTTPSRPVPKVKTEQMPSLRNLPPVRGPQAREAYVGPLEDEPPSASTEPMPSPFAAPGSVDQSPDPAPVPPSATLPEPPRRGTLLPLFAGLLAVAVIGGGSIAALLSGAGDEAPAGPPPAVPMATLAAANVPPRAVPADRASPEEDTPAAATGIPPGSRAGTAPERATGAAADPLGAPTPPAVGEAKGPAEPTTLAATGAASPATPSPAKPPPDADDSAPPPRHSPVATADPAPRTVSRARRGSGTLTVNAQPYALVTVGRYKAVEVMGRSTPFVLPAGSYEVVLQHPRRNATEHVVIRAGQTATVNFKAR